MGRDLRFIPPNSLVEVTCRTLHGRFLLKPHPDLNPIIIGVLAKAQERYGMTVCAFVSLARYYGIGHLRGGRNTGPPRNPRDL